MSETHISSAGSDGRSGAGQQPGEVALARTLTLWLLVLYGIGVTIGAGIYVLIGATAARAGLHAPVAFVVAAAVMGPSAYSFSKLSQRYPVSAGEAAYVDAAFGSHWFTLAIGLMVVTVGTVSASAISIGAAGYIQEFIAAPTWIIVTCLVCGLGLIAAWGVRESVIFAGVMTIMEVVGLMVVIIAGLFYFPDKVVATLPLTLPPLEPAAWAMILPAGLLAFFAFIGFEDLVNMAEEVKNPQRNMPIAIFTTLIVVLVIYVAVAVVAVSIVPVSDLAASRAPIALVFERATGSSSAMIAGIAIVATVNGVIVQIIMGSRILFGLARRGHLPALLGRANPVTRTPLEATFLISGIVLVLALAVPLTALAQFTSQITLVVFSCINAALWHIVRREIRQGQTHGFIARWLPALGVAACLSLLAAGLL